MTLIKKHLYTHTFRDSTRSTLVEGELAQLEGYVTTLVDKVLTRAHSGDKLGLTPAERDLWWRYLYSQCMRRPSIRDELREGNYRPERQDEIEYALRRPLSAGELDDFNDPAVKEMMADRVWLGTMTAMESDPSWSMLAFINRGIGAIVIKDPRDSFVTGDMPLLKIPSPTASLVSPEARLLYPISWDIMVEWGLPDGGDEVRLLSDHRCICALNEMLVSQSSVVVGRSEELIRSLSRSTADQR